MSQRKRASPRKPRQASPVLRGGLRSYTAWKLEDAKARFSEVVRRARSEGPQRVTVRGQDAVVVIATEDLDELLPSARRPVPLVPFLESLDAGELDLTREPDHGRDVDL